MFSAARFDEGVVRWQVSRILQFNRRLEALRGDSELVPGVGRTSVWGGKYDSASGDGKGRDLRDLFKVVVEERLRRDGEITAVRARTDEWVPLPRLREGQSKFLRKMPCPAPSGAWQPTSATVGACWRYGQYWMIGSSGT
jgi:hypothetical protein